MPDDHLDQVAAEVRVCQKCILAQSRTHAVPGEGPVNVSIMFIGEGPGFHEDQQGRPFVGAAGHSLGEFAALVYAKPQYVETLARSTAISEHVKVDFELRGCPISKAQLLDVITALLRGRAPLVPAYSVCQECKQRGLVCVLVAHGTPCLGPVTQAGCGAICPAYLRGCFACFGPKEAANPLSLARRWRDLGLTDSEIVRALRTFTTNAETFAQAAQALERRQEAR